MAGQAQIYDTKTGQWLDADGNPVGGADQNAPPPGYSSWDQFTASSPYGSTPQGVQNAYYQSLGGVPPSSVPQGSSPPPATSGIPSIGSLNYGDPTQQPIDSYYGAAPQGGAPPPSVNGNIPYPGAPPSGYYPSTLPAPSYTEGDPGYMSSSDRNYAYSAEQMFQGQFQDAAAQYADASSGYQQAGDTAYSDLYNNPGFSPQDASNIIQAQGLQDAMTTPEQFQSNFLTPDQINQMRGNPNAPLTSFQTGPAAMENQITQQGQLAQNQAYQQGQQAVIGPGGAVDSGIQAQNNWQDQYGSALDSTIQGGADVLSDPSKYLLSDADVQMMEEQARQQIGAQIGTARDQLIRQSSASGTSSPLQTAAALGRMNQQEGIQGADAVTNATLAAKEAQIGAQTGYAGLEQGQEQIAGGLQNTYGTERASVLSNEMAQNIAAQEQEQALGINTQSNIENQNLGANQYIGSTEANLQQTAEQEAASRAASIAQNDQTTNEQNQWAQWGQGYAANQALSSRYYSTAEQAKQDQQQARTYLQGQGQWTGSQGLNYSQGEVNALNTTGNLAANATKTASTTEIGRRGNPGAWALLGGQVASGAINAATGW